MWQYECTRQDRFCLMCTWYQLVSTNFIFIAFDSNCFDIFSSIATRYQVLPRFKSLYRKCLRTKKRKTHNGSNCMCDNYMCVCVSFVCRINTYNSWANYFCNCCNRYSNYILVTLPSYNNYKILYSTVYINSACKTRATVTYIVAITVSFFLISEENFG